VQPGSAGAVSTIGVSIAVPDPCGSQLQDYRIGLGDESARQIPTHITLLGPHEVTDTDLPAVLDHLTATAGTVQPFRVHLRGTGTFRPLSPVVFIGVVEGISQCEQLTAMVRSGPSAPQVRFPYHPHVTIAQDVEDRLLDQAFTDLADFDCVFDAAEFHLYAHDVATGWRPARTFPLG
jgi:2'-5' RNA ligase